MAFNIPQGGHSVIAAVTAASLMLAGAAGFTVVLETPLTQALAAAPAAPPVIRMLDASGLPAQDFSMEPPAARLARWACNRWRANQFGVISPAHTRAAWTYASSGAHPLFPPPVTAGLSGSNTDPNGARCDVSELVVSRDWVVARLNVHGGQAGGASPTADAHAVEVMHLTNGHIDEDWRLASNREW